MKVPRSIRVRNCNRLQSKGEAVTCESSTIKLASQMKKKVWKITKKLRLTKSRTRHARLKSHTTLNLPMRCSSRLSVVQLHLQTKWVENANLVSKPFQHFRSVRLPQLIWFIRHRFSSFIREKMKVSFDSKIAWDNNKYDNSRLGDSKNAIKQFSFFD